MSDTLVLNADGLPVSLLPISTISWQESIKYMCLDKADVLLWHENWIVHSATWETPVPSVIMLREYMKSKTTVRFSRANVYLRDNGQCQYCGDTFDHKDLTIDHVIPRANGGRITWENAVTACHPCNHKKGSKLWKPLRMPYRPDYYQLVNKWKTRSISIDHPSWYNYLGIENKSIGTAS